MTGGTDSMQVGVACTCGWSAVIESPAGGQTLFGTAGYRMARHEMTCKKTDGTAIDWRVTG